MPDRLVVIAGPDRGRAFSLVEGHTLVIGRGRTTQTQLKDPHVSRIHCRVQAEGAAVLVSDAGSAGGTLINGKKIAGPYPLQPGDLLQIGTTQLRFERAPTLEAATLMPAGGPPASQPAATGAKRAATARPAPDTPKFLSDLVGKTLARFAVGSLIAEGKSGSVFRAQDLKENRPVALKVLQLELSENDEDMRRFVRAMKTMLPLRHPNLVALYGAGKSGPYCWMAMEYIDGESLAQVIRRIGVAGMLSWRYSLRVAIHVGRALDFAYEQKIIHRNVTPTNILVRGADTFAKLGDLMLAKALEGTSAEQITRTGQLVGDVAYMSPERTRGGDQVDARSDIYGLGATLYALLTGRPPLVGVSLADTITQIREAQPLSPKESQPSMPDLLEAAVLRMLAKRPEDRFQRPAEFLTDLERLAKREGAAV